MLQKYYNCIFVQIQEVSPLGKFATELKTDFEKIDQLKKEVEYLKGVTLIAIEKFEKDLESVEINTKESESCKIESLGVINIISPATETPLPPLKDSIKQIK